MVDPEVFARCCGMEPTEFDVLDIFKRRKNKLVVTHNRAVEFLGLTVHDNMLEYRKDTTLGY